MTITLSKPIAIILLVCLAIIVICDIAIWILNIYQQRLDKKERKYEIAIGKYDKELNRKNRSVVLIGKTPTICKYCKYYAYDPQSGWKTCCHHNAETLLPRENDTCESWEINI